MLVLLLFAIFGLATSACPEGYEQINGDDCFKLYATPSAFDTAEAQCMQDGGHLASLHSPIEQNGLSAMMGATTPLIGMQCTGDTVDDCTWIDDSAVDYSFPGTGIHSDLGQCVHLSNTDTKWYPWNCNDPIGAYLCRVPFDIPPATPCTGDYVEYNGGCAAVKTVVKTRSDAEADCVLEGGHLASIQSEEDNEFYTDLASNKSLTNNIYIGLAYKNGNGYTWSDGTVSDYTNFANPFPNTVYGECVQLLLTTSFGTLGQWTNIPCDTPLFYVCWKPSGAAIQPKAPAQCEPIKFFYDEGTIYSPNFPISIPSGQTCTYMLATAIGTKVSVSFPAFSTDTGSTLALYDGMDDLTPKTTLFGTVNPQLSFESATNIMKMIFTASDAATGSGWQANFGIAGDQVIPVTDTPVDPVDPSDQCPPQQYYADTIVYSPNWPDPYFPMANCLYYIHSRDNRNMSIEFAYVNTEQCCDYVNVYDGPDNMSRLLGRVSGDKAQQFYSTGNILTLEFFSDSNNQGKGWVATVVNL